MKPVMQSKTVVMCLRNGKGYSFRDAELLAHHLQKNSSDKLRIICLWDRVSQEFSIDNMTVQPPHNKTWLGWWTKLNIFAPEMEQYRPFLFLDLDTAIVGNIDSFFENDPQQLILLEDFYRSGKANTGVMWIPSESEKVKKIWDRWLLDPLGFSLRYKVGDAAFINSTVTPDHLWQNLTNEITSFKPEGMSSRLKEIPEGKSIVCFHGQPRCWEAAKSIEWVKKYCEI